MNASLGRYRAYGTYLHKLDPRIKLIGFLLFMVAAFLNYGTSYMNLLVYGGILLILISLSLLGKVSFLSVFRSLKALWVMILFLLILNIFFNGDTTSDILFTIGKTDIRIKSLMNVSYVFVRLLLVLIMTNIFTSTTKPMEMTGALEWLLYPLKLIKIPIHKFAMAISLALRFIPTLQEETARIMKAQASRGVDYQQGKFREKIKALVSLIIPLFMSAFMTSGELADAMEARGYDPDAKRTRYQTRVFGYRDVIGILFLSLLLTSIIVLAYFKFDLFSYLHISVPNLGA